MKEDYEVNRRELLASTAAFVGLAGCGTRYDEPEEEENYTKVDAVELILDSQEYEGEFIHTQGYAKLIDDSVFECPTRLERAYELVPEKPEEDTLEEIASIYLAEIDYHSPQEDEEPPLDPVRSLNGEELIQGTEIEIKGKMDNLHRSHSDWSGCQEATPAIYVHQAQLK